MVDLGEVFRFATSSRVTERSTRSTFGLSVF